MTTIIQVNNLQKYFKLNKHHRGLWGTFRNFVSREYTLVRAVDDISFQIQAGELVGYLGPNGAGKSTTIKMLTGLLVPSQGDILVNGYLPWRDRQAYVAQIGAVFGQRTTLWWDLPVIESLDLLQHIYQIPSENFARNFNEFRERLALDEFLNAPVRTLSLGQRMRADICAAMLHEPTLLFLDEPTIGLDVVAKEQIRQFIKHVNQTHQTTILLTTHDLQEVEKLCERIMIIDRGKLLFDGTLAALQARFGGQRELAVDFAEQYSDVSVAGAAVIAHEGLQAVYQFDQGTTTASELIGRLSTHYRIQDLSVREPDIETTIRRIYEEGLLAQVEAQSAHSAAISGI